MGEQVGEGGAVARAWDLVLRATGGFLQKTSLTRALVPESCHVLSVQLGVQLGAQPLPTPPGTELTIS